MENKIFSMIVSPCNNLAEGISNGNYDAVYDQITEQTISLAPVEGEKKVIFLPVREEVKTGDEELYVNKFGYQLCKFSPNYLLGSITQLSKNKFPDSLKGKILVAAEKASASVFLTKQSNFEYFLCMKEEESSNYRQLVMLPLYGNWPPPPDGNYVFLCEELPS